MVTDRPLPNDWILLLTCKARMGELHSVYRWYPGYAQRDLEAAVRAGRAALRGYRPGQADHPPETIDAPITVRHRLDIEHSTLSERRPGPLNHSVLLFRDVEIEWNAIKEYLQACAAECWPTGGIQKRRQRERLKEEKGAKETRSRGPLRGTIDRYGKADKELFPAIEKMIQEGCTVDGAALALAHKDMVRGVGTSASRATRLAKRFRKYRNSLQQNLTRSD